MNTGLFDRAATDTVNNAGGKAYKFDAKHELAQVAATGCFSNTYYVKAEEQLSRVIELSKEINDVKYLAKLALYSREKAFMKDMPCALLAIVSGKSPELTRVIFPRIIDSGRTLRTFTQMIRSGKFGKKGFSACIKKLASEWLNNASITALLNASIGDKPSLRDVLRLVRPKPKDDTRKATFAYLVGKRGEMVGDSLGCEPEEIVLLEKFRRAETDEEQAEIAGKLRCRWDLLSSHAKGPKTWNAIMRKMGYQALRMNLNTLNRHGVLKGEANEYICRELVNEEKIIGSRQFPYQMFSAYKAITDDIPHDIKSALSKATEIACKNVPKISGNVLIGVDVSGSMRGPVTGNQVKNSKMRCVDVAALFASAIVKKNKDAVVIPFDNEAYQGKFDADNSITSIADTFAQLGGGGTYCSLPFQVANTHMAARRFDVVFLISDNESWINNGPSMYTSRTNAKNHLEHFKRLQRVNHHCKPKLVCIDITPNNTTQVRDDSSTLNIGGFSDAIFGTINRFLEGTQDSFVKEVEAIDL